MRSGSTWSYNVCKIFGGRVAENRKFNFHSDFAYDIDSLIQKMSKKAARTKSNIFGVVKAHDVGMRTKKKISEGKIKNIYTIRDPRDCFASMEKFMPRFEGVEIDDRIREFQRWLILGDEFFGDDVSLIIRYEEMVENNIKQIRRIANFLEIKRTDKLILNISNATSVAASQEIIKQMIETGKGVEKFKVAGKEKRFHPESQLHENHLNGGTIGRWRTELTEENQQKIHTAFSPWLIKFGYVNQDATHHPNID